MFVIDNTILSNFALTGDLMLLEEFCGGRGAVTAHVLSEFEIGVREGILADADLDWLMKLELDSRQETTLFENLNKRLGAGESSCLAIAVSRGYGILSDDMSVRKIAMREGVQLSGSIGVIAELIKSNRIDLDRGNDILRGFIRYGYFSPVDKLDDLI